MSCYVCKGSHLRLWLVHTDGVRFYVRTEPCLDPSLSEVWLCLRHCEGIR